MTLILFIILGLWAWFSCGMHGKARAVWATLAVIVLTAPVGNGAILLGTLPASPIIYLFILSALNSLAQCGVINPLPLSKDPREKLKGKNFLQILSMIFLRRRGRYI